MSELETIYAAGAMGYAVAVPVLRGLAGILLAVAISKDCKARENGSAVIWGIFVILAPALAGIIYFIYSRFFAEKKEITPDKKRKIKSSKCFCFLSVTVYVSSVAMLIVSVVVIAASGLTSLRSGEILFPYCDRNGVEYSTSLEVPLYDEQGNEYHNDRVQGHLFMYAYYDSQGNAYSEDKSFIDENGYYFYDENNELVLKDDGYYYDSEGKKYAFIDGNAYWDADGRINFKSGRMSYYAFE